MGTVQAVCRGRNQEGLGRRYIEAVCINNMLYVISMFKCLSERSGAQNEVDVGRS